MPSLFVIQGRDQGTRFELDRDTVSLGREITNAVQVHDTEVSRRHAEIRREGDGYTLIDLGSSNGCYVNGQRVQHCELASGDRIQVGRTLMLFTDPAEGALEDLSSKIDIIRGASGEGSRIVRSVTQKEGSEIFSLDAIGSQSPWLARARSNLQIMYRTALAVSHTLDIDQLLNRIMEMIFEWVEADRGCIMLVTPESKQLEPRVRRHRKGLPADEKITISNSILDYVMEHGEGVLTSDASDDRRWNPTASLLQMNVREAICVPMQGRYDMVGVIYIDTSISPQRLISHGGNKFTEEHLKLMVAIGHQAALAVEDTSYYSAMVQAERLAAVGQTIATLSHHIKNILQGIRGGSYLIEMGLNQHDEEVVRKGWGMVERNQNKISTLVLDMLTFSKEREPEPEPSQLNTVTAEVVELMQSRAQEMNVALDYQPAEDMPIGTFDPEGLHRAILNVVTNAIDACSEREQGRVTISTRHLSEPALFQVIVQDNGGGIQPEDLDRIFVPFASNKGSRGTGLGLPVSQKILKEHGGQIRVESTPDVGSRFTLEFPASISDSAIQKTMAEPPLTD